MTKRSDLLRQRAPTHRTRLHHDCLRHHRAPAPHAGHDTWFLTGTDEHGQKIERAAQSAGKTPQQFTDEVSAEFRALWQRMGLTHDDFIRTTSDRHKQGVQAFGARSATTDSSTKAPTPANTASPTSSTSTVSAPAIPAPTADAPPKPSAKKTTTSSSPPFRTSCFASTPSSPISSAPRRAAMK
jgi:hypothetical protein